MNVKIIIRCVLDRFNRVVLWKLIPIVSYSR